MILLMKSGHFQLVRLSESSLLTSDARPAKTMFSISALIRPRVACIAGICRSTRFIDLRTIGSGVCNSSSSPSGPSSVCGIWSDSSAVSVAKGYGFSGLHVMERNLSETDRVRPHIAQPAILHVRDHPPAREVPRAIQDESNCVEVIWKIYSKARWP